MERWLDMTLLQRINELFWHDPFYVVIYIASLVTLVVFWKTMKRGRRFFLMYSVLCLALFILNPISVNLFERYFLYNERVTVRLFLLLPLVFTEAYVVAALTYETFKKNSIVSIAFTVAFTSLFLFFGVTPWNREKVGFDGGMYLLAENAYKIPQEHIDICDAILTDMDGNRAVLSMYELHEINDIGGTLNYSIRMYTSRIQLDKVLELGAYEAMSFDERVSYWDEYIATVQSYDTDSSSIYFLFPENDERATDLLEYGCSELLVDSSNYQVLVYTP